MPRYVTPDEDRARCARQAGAANRRPMAATTKANARVASPGPRLRPVALDRQTDALADSLAQQVRDGTLDIGAARLIARLFDLTTGAA